MRRLRVVLAVLLVAGVVAVGVGLAQIADPRWQSLATTRPESPIDRLRRDERAPLLFVPDSVARDPRAPATLVIVLPGLGGTARPMADQLTAAAERDRWLLLAPSPDYDPRSAGESINAADLRVDDDLVALIATAATRSPAPLAPLVDLIGFSRGAQQAHRFVLRHPERVSALASFSAGTYTMPTSNAAYPLGVGSFELWDHERALDLVSLRKVRVLVGVGALDNEPDDVPRAWDEVGGTNRVDRALRFAGALSQLTVPYKLQRYAGVGHAFVSAMRDDAVAWLEGK